MRKVGGIYFFSFGRFGGSLYLKRRPVPTLHAKIAAHYEGFDWVFGPAILIGLGANCLLALGIIVLIVGKALGYH